MPPSASNLEEEEEDEDDGGECLSEVCQLDLDAKMWVQLPISGPDHLTSPHALYTTRLANALPQTA